VFSGTAGADDRIAVVDDAPGSRDQDPIFVGLLKAIASCQGPGDGPIDIENAYFILNPALRQALREARARGVQVRILSNSPESVDVPIISAPVYESLAEMAVAGCEVYLKTGATLHSKIAAVGKSFATVGSYNLHPQSIKLKGETNAFILGERFTSTLRRQFELDIGAATRLDPASITPSPPNPLNFLVQRFFYDFL
jgi:cardiolipin synthase